DYVQYLSGRGVPVAKPLVSQSGKLIEVFESDGLELYACVFEAAPGARLTWQTPNWNADNFLRWGRALGLLHTNTLPASVLRTPRRISWNEDDVWTNADIYLANEPSARRELSSVRDWLKDQ